MILETDLSRNAKILEAKNQKKKIMKYSMLIVACCPDIVSQNQETVVWI